MTYDDIILLIIKISNLLEIDSLIHTGGSRSNPKEIAQAYLTELLDRINNREEATSERADNQTIISLYKFITIYFQKCSVDLKPSINPNFVTEMEEINSTHSASIEEYPLIQELEADFAALELQQPELTVAIREIPSNPQELAQTRGQMHSPSSIRILDNRTRLEPIPPRVPLGFLSELARRFRSFLQEHDAQMLRQLASQLEARDSYMKSHVKQAFDSLLAMVQSNVQEDFADFYNVIKQLHKFVELEAQTVYELKQEVQEQKESLTSQSETILNLQLEVAKLTETVSSQQAELSILHSTVASQAEQIQELRELICQQATQMKQLVQGRQGFFQPQKPMHQHFTETQVEHKFLSPQLFKQQDEQMHRSPDKFFKYQGQDPISIPPKGDGTFPASAQPTHSPKESIASSASPLSTSPQTHLG